MWKKKQIRCFFLEKYPTHKEKVRGMLRAEFMNWIFRFAIIKLRLHLRYWRMNNNSKREINFFSHWRVTRYPKATYTPLELRKYADFTKPVFCPFRNHRKNFWIVVRVFRAQLGLVCGRQIQVWPYLSVDEQCEFLDGMDFDAIFQQINLRYQWAVWVYIPEI